MPYAIIIHQVKADNHQRHAKLKHTLRVHSMQILSRAAKLPTHMVKVTVKRSLQKEFSDDYSMSRLVHLSYRLSWSRKMSFTAICVSLCRNHVDANILWI